MFFSLIFTFNGFKLIRNQLQYQFISTMIEITIFLQPTHARDRVGPESKILNFNAQTTNQLILQLSIILVLELGIRGLNLVSFMVSVRSGIIMGYDFSVACAEYISCARQGIEKRKCSRSSTTNKNVAKSRAGALNPRRFQRKALPYVLMYAVCYGCRNLH